MRSILLRDIFLEIKATFGRFIAIFAIVALGVGFFAGLKATTPDMKETADSYFDEQNMMDVRLLSTVGFTEDDVQAIAQQPGVRAVMPTYSTDALMDTPAGNAVMKVHSADFWAEDWTREENMNRPVLVDGRWPKSSGECLLDANALAVDNGAKIGDTIALSADNEADTKDLFATQQFEVVGTVQSPYYISFERGNTNIGTGKIASYIIIPEQDFASDYYLELFVTVDGADEYLCYAEPYEDLIDGQIDALKLLAADREQIRYDEIQSEADTEIADAEQTLAAARVELADGEAELAEHQKEYDDAEAEYARGKQEADEKLQDARAELADGERKLKNGEKELASSRTKLEEGQAAYNQGVRELESRIAAGQQEIDSGHTQLMPQKEQLQQAEQQLAQGWQQHSALLEKVEQLLALGMEEQAAALQAQADALQAELIAQEQMLAAGAAEIQQAEQALAQAQSELDAAQTKGNAQLVEAKAELDSGRQQLMAGEQELEQARADLSAGNTAYEDAEREADEELQEAREQLDDAKIKLDDGRTELAEGRQEVADGEQELADAKVELADLEPPEWYVLSRDTNPGYAGYGSDADKIDAISSVFPVFFFLVASLVCLTTMTRMVEEQRTQMGVLKALGYSNAAVASKYIIYALIASLTGSVVGLLIGFKVFPTAIFHAYSIMYTLPPIQTAFRWDLALVATGAAVASTVLAAIGASLHEMLAMPAELIRPKAPPAGKRVFLEHIPAIWKRMKFTSKVTVRNLFRYKKRFFMTVIGIGGCTALMLTGFGLRDSIASIVTHQFDQLHHYDTIITTDDSSAHAEDTPLNEALQALDGDYMYMEQPPITAKKNGASLDGYIMVAEDAERLNEFISFRERKTQQPVLFPQAGEVVVTEKLATALDVGLGDSFVLTKGETDTATVTVGGITENYIFNYVYMAPEEYTKAFGPPEYKEILLQLNSHKPEGEPVLDEAEENTLSSKLLGVPGAESVTFTTKLSRDFEDIMGSLDAVVWLLIFCANMLAFIVLYNLVNINVTERIREIATIKVLGFYDREVSAYVYRENVILTAIGVVGGLIGGIFLHRFVVTTAEVDMVMFERSILPSSYLYSVALTFAFAFVVNFFMHFRLKKISMVESMKSTE